MTIASVSGYWTSGDGGGGLFLWAPDESLPADGGTVIAGFPAAPGRWLRMGRGPVMVSWFGAVAGDASSSAKTLNRERIQRAIDSVAAAGGSVGIPPGTYAVVGSLDVSRGKELRLAGSARGSQLLFDSDGEAIRGVDVDGFTIENITVGGRYARGVDIRGSGNSRAARVVVRQCAFTGFSESREPAMGGVYLERVDDARIIACSFDSRAIAHKSGIASVCVLLRECLRGLITRNFVAAAGANMGIGVEDCSHTQVTNNTVEGARSRPTLDAWGYGIYFYRSPGAAVPTTQNSCEDNFVRSTDGSGIYLQGSSFSRVARNTVERACVRVTGVSLVMGAIALTSGSSDCLVAGNTVVDVGNATVPRPGIAFGGPRTTVSKNYVVRTSGIGIQYGAGADEAEIRQNTVIRAGQAGIAPYPHASLNGLVIAHNFVIEPGGTGIACQGARSHHLVGVVLRSNAVRAASGAGITMEYTDRFQATDNVVRDSGQGGPRYSGLYVANCADGTISRNEASNSAGRTQLHGIQIVASTGLHVTANRLEHNAGSPVSLADVRAVTVVND